MLRGVPMYDLVRVKSDREVAKAEAGPVAGEIRGFRQNGILTIVENHKRMELTCATEISSNQYKTKMFNLSIKHFYVSTITITDKRHFF